MVFWENLKHLHVPAQVNYIGEKVIHAPADSYAAQYADENWIQWVPEAE